MSLNKRLIGTGGGGLDGSLSSFTLSSTKTNITFGKDIWFSPDGTRFYTIETISNNGFIRQYLLSTAWDLSTAVLEYSRNCTALGENSDYQLYGICTSYDGIYGWTQQTDEIGCAIYTMTTPHDFSTATYQGAATRGYGSDYIDSLRGGNRNGGICSVPDGSYLTFNSASKRSACSGDTAIYKLVPVFLPTPNDIQSAQRGWDPPFVCTQKKNNYGRGVCYNGDGSKIYFCGEINSSGIYEYDLGGSPYAATGASGIVGGIGGDANGIYMSPDNTKFFICRGSSIETYLAA